MLYAQRAESLGRRPPQTKGVTVESVPSFVNTPAYVAALNRGLWAFFSEFVRMSLPSPRRAWFFLMALVVQVRAAILRGRWRRRGVHVPPIAIFSIMERCNLRCRGCCAQALRRTKSDALREEDLRRVISQGAALASPFLHALRQNHGDFAETTGGCSLWRHRDRLRALLAAQASG